jgi:hypothetical protein
MYVVALITSLVLGTKVWRGRTLKAQFQSPTDIGENLKAFA